VRVVAKGENPAINGLRARSSTDRASAFEAERCPGRGPATARPASTCSGHVRPGMRRRGSLAQSQCLPRPYRRVMLRCGLDREERANARHRPSDLVKAHLAQMRQAKSHNPLRLAELDRCAELEGEIDGLAVAQLARERSPKVQLIYSAEYPHRIPRARMIDGSPCFRSPYGAQQIAGVINAVISRRAMPEAA
jgi:hypothetical protein